MTSFRGILLVLFIIFAALDATATISKWQGFNLGGISAINLPSHYTLATKGTSILKATATEFANLIVFINPKSGGKKGVDLLKSFQNVLNPTQVFDLTQGGPEIGFSLFRNVPNLRILACGGDGTVGWVLSVLDQMNFRIQPAVAIFPLGTGNDLARTFGWGGDYHGASVSTIFEDIANAYPAVLDRWRINVSPNLYTFDDGLEGRYELPLNVMNNYFSFGIDAQITLDFHEAREAHPNLLNSLIRNKLVYGGLAVRDFINAKWTNLSEMVTIECDGYDITSSLARYHVHAVLFLNIPLYASGTRPWNISTNDQSISDGVIEVVGLTGSQLAKLQIGEHGTHLARCATARIITTKTIPMQVDGEATMLKPSIIELSFLNKALMLTKTKPKYLQKLSIFDRCRIWRSFCRF